MSGTGKSNEEIASTAIRNAYFAGSPVCIPKNMQAMKLYTVKAIDAKDAIIAEREARIKELEDAIKSKCSSMLMIEGCDEGWCKDCVLKQALRRWSNAKA